MNAILQRDGSLALSDGKVISPNHAGHAALLRLYHERAGTPAKKPRGEWPTFSLSAGYGGHPWMDGEPDFNEVYQIPMEHIHVDPERLQYKKGACEETGIVSELDHEDVEAFDPDKCDPLKVWKDHADGKTYVADGHHRRELGERAGVETLPCQYIKAKSAEEAKKIGAKCNGVSLSLAASEDVRGEAVKALRERFPLGDYALSAHDVSSQARNEGGEWTTGGPKKIKQVKMANGKTKFKVTDARGQHGALDYFDTAEEAQAFIDKKPPGKSAFDLVTDGLKQWPTHSREWTANIEGPFLARIKAAPPAKEAEADIKKTLDAFSAKSPTEAMRLCDLYDDVKKKHPDVSKDSFLHSLSNGQDDGRWDLSVWTQPLFQMPEEQKDFVVLKDKEIWLYARGGKANA